MLGERKCYLCGGSLVGGRCALCGLDNSKRDRRTYRLNETSMKRVIREIEDGHSRDDSRQLKKMQSRSSMEKKRRGWVPTASVKKIYNGGFKSGSSQTSRRTGASESGVSWSGETQTGSAPSGGIGAGSRKGGFRTGKSRGGNPKVGIVIFLIILIFNILPVVISLLGSIFSMVADGIEDIFPIIPEDSQYQVDEDRYPFVTRELSPVGDSSSFTLMPGEYIVGVHLPEGCYTASIEAGSGAMLLDDRENYIYYYTFFHEDGEKEGSVTVQEDVRLYDGAHVRVDTGLRLRMETKNGQTEQMAYEENPLTEAVTLSSGKKYVAGKDFPAGVYNVAAEPMTDVAYTVYLDEPNEDGSENCENEYLWFNVGDGEGVYNNAVFPENTVVSVESEGMEITLTPSERIKNQDYLSYYME